MARVHSTNRSSGVRKNGTSFKDALGNTNLSNARRIVQRSRAPPEIRVKYKDFKLTEELKSQLREQGGRIDYGNGVFLDRSFSPAYPPQSRMLATERFRLYFQDGKRQIWTIKTWSAREKNNKR